MKQSGRIQAGSTLAAAPVAAIGCAGRVEQRAAIAGITRALVGATLSGIDSPRLAETKAAFAGVEQLKDCGHIIKRRVCSNCHSFEAHSGAVEITERGFELVSAQVIERLVRLGDSLQLFTLKNFNNPSLPKLTRECRQSGNPTLCSGLFNHRFPNVFS